MERAILLLALISTPDTAIKTFNHRYMNLEMSQ